jgi:hypothetical protein
MDTKKVASNLIKLADNSLILEAMTMSPAKLIESGYIKLDGKALARFSPVINLIESLGFQKWVGRTQAKNIGKVLEGSYRCIIDGDVLSKDVLAHVKDSPLYRGLIMGKDGIEKHAMWQKIDPKEIANTIGKAPAPNVVAIIFQALAIATSQYYMHEMNNNFESICTEIKSIKEQFMIQDASEIIAGHKSISNMVKHFDSIMDSENRRQSESIKAGQIEFDALKQLERCRLKLEKNFPLDPKKDSLEKVDANVTGIINTIAQMKMSVYVYGMSKGLRVCFDAVDESDEIDDFISEINEQIDLYKETVNKTIEALNKYTTDSKALNKASKKQVGGLIAVGLLAGPLAPALVGGLEANQIREMKERRVAHKSSIESRIKENVSLNDIDTLSASVVFLEDYAASLDSTLEIVSNDNDYYLKPAAKNK